MPVSNGSMMDLPSEYVKVKAHYGGDMLISDLDLAMTYTEVCEEVRTMCGVRKEMPITLKWIDDEGDPCTISSQMELEEAFRIYNRNRRSGLLLHGTHSLRTSEINLFSIVLVAELLYLY
ncbi:protein kinase C zeta type-like [Cyprinus carpio]|uniref:Protein kinase C zeta type-like n=1 Tax=Cyprinus carpio TaxID=7962 RepID=A0A9R0ATS6_CYPCA|nr:protein kinase C zeta type-like [Cyprinus carpio]